MSSGHLALRATSKKRKLITARGGSRKCYSIEKSRVFQKESLLDNYQIKAPHEFHWNDFATNRKFKTLCLIDPNSHQIEDMTKDGAPIGREVVVAIVANRDIRKGDYCNHNISETLGPGPGKAIIF